MSEEIEKHILRKYEVSQKLGKGVRMQQLVVAVVVDDAAAPLSA